MDTNEFEEIAYTMAEAFENNSSMKDDIQEVLEQYPHARRLILSAMWQAIYAYNDTNGVAKSEPKEEIPIFKGTLASLEKLTIR